MPKNKPQNKPQTQAKPAAQPQRARSADMDVTAAGQNAGIQLPPALANLIATLRDDRKSLLKDRHVSDEGTTRFLAHFLYPRLIESVEILGVGLTETYGVASQAMTETFRMRDYVDNKVANAPETAPEGTVVVDADDLGLLRQALAALGLILQAKLPEDAETQTAFNLVTEAFTAIAGDGAVAVDDDEDEEEEEDEEGDEDEDEEEDDEGDEDEDEDDEAEEDEDEFDAAAQKAGAPKKSPAKETRA